MVDKISNSPSTLNSITAASRPDPIAKLASAQEARKACGTSYWRMLAM